MRPAYAFLHDAHQVTKLINEAVNELSIDEDAAAEATAKSA